MRAISTALLASVVCVYAAQGPAESAVDFVKKLGTGKVDLAAGTDTAIVSEISAQKKESILQRLERLAGEIKGEEVEVGPTRMEGTLAGVIVRMVDPGDPMDVRVLPVAMVRDGDTWRAAPVLASFENTSAAYSRSSRTISQELELWLAQEQVKEVERLQIAAGNRLRDSLAKSLSPEKVRAWREEDAVAEFLSACDRRDIPRILALLGGLSDPLPDGWRQLSAAVEIAVTSPGQVSDTWSLLTSPSVLRHVSAGEQIPDTRTSMHRVLCVDPRSGEVPSLYEVGITVEPTVNGLWKITPESQPSPVEEEEIPGITAKLISGKHTLRPQSSAEALKTSLIHSYRSPDSPYTCLDYLYRDNNTAADLPRYLHAISARWETMNPSKPVIPMELGFQVEADQAYLAVQWLALGRLAYEPRIFHFQKMPEGWVWNSSPDKTVAVLAEKWMKKNEFIWKKSFLSQTVQFCALPDFTLPSPDESQASAIVQNYVDALAATNWHKALSLCAQLGIEKSPALLLRNLGYECKSFHIASDVAPYRVPVRGKSITLVAIRSKSDTGLIQSFLPVVSTPAGPRILMEIDLGDPSRPGRAFLNRNALERLDSVHATVAEELKGLISMLLDAGMK